MASLRVNSASSTSRKCLAGTQEPPYVWRWSRAKKDWQHLELLMLWMMGREKANGTRDRNLQLTVVVAVLCSLPQTLVQKVYLCVLYSLHQNLVRNVFSWLLILVRLPVGVKVYSRTCIHRYHLQCNILTLATQTVGLKSVLTQSHLSLRRPLFSSLCLGGDARYLVYCFIAIKWVTTGSDVFAIILHSEKDYI